MLHVTHVTRYVWPQDDAERERIEAEMAGDPDTSRILDALRATRWVPHVLPHGQIIL